MLGVRYYAEIEQKGMSYEGFPEVPSNNFLNWWPAPLPRSNHSSTSSHTSTPGSRTMSAGDETDEDEQHFNSGSSDPGFINSLAALGELDDESKMQLYFEASIWVRFHGGRSTQPISRLCWVPHLPVVPHPFFYILIFQNKLLDAGLAFDLFLSPAPCQLTNAGLVFDIVPPPAFSFDTFSTPALRKLLDAGLVSAQFCDQHAVNYQMLVRSLFVFSSPASRKLQDAGDLNHPDLKNIKILV
ncbi:hypothetical protein BDV93DRAFT_515428 [Ceratobasidium sp. AG-I]|nr:hypothetical protein BDV93DRAFT_515428 [Ceratobasidium sp. AG-I]